MSESTLTGARRAEAPAADAGPERGRRLRGKLLFRLALVVLAVLLPFYLDSFFLQVGVFAFAAAIGAIGLNILVGTTGQLSLAHAFFLAVGAYGYTFFAASSNSSKGTGLALPPALALVLAVLLAGLAGLLFSPIAGRLRGIYLGVASIGLVFLGQHVLFNAPSVTGGFNGRDVPPFSLFGFSFTDSHPDLFVLNVPFGGLERLWYLALVLFVAAFLFAENIVRGRPGRALQTLRDSEVAAAVMGVNVTGYKARAFMVSSMYAGLAGGLLALAFRHTVPETFSLLLSIDYLAMIVIGGLGSVAGAAVGATFVTILPPLFTRYSDSLPFLAAPGSGGVGPGEAARFLYGAAVIAVILFEPGGLAALGRRLIGRRPRGSSLESPPGSRAGPPPESRPEARSTQAQQAPPVSANRDSKETAV